MGLLKDRIISVCLIPAMIFIVGCWPTNDLRKLTYYGETKKVREDQLKINGIYYSILSKKNTRFWDHDQLDAFVLYNNGTYLHLLSTEMDSSEFVKGINRTVKFSRERKYFSGDITFWGAFKISNDTLFLQRYSRTAGVMCQVYSNTATIVNDSTLRFNERYTLISDDYPGIGQEFHFYEMKNKPDSINLFMTNSHIHKKLERLYKKRHPLANEL